MANKNDVFEPEFNFDAIEIELWVEEWYEVLEEWKYPGQVDGNKVLTIRIPLSH